MNEAEFKAKYETLKTKLEAGRQDVAEDFEAFMKTMASEGEDFFRGFWVGLIFGPDAYDKVMVRGNDKAEKLGYQTGLGVRPILFAWLVEALAGKKSAEVARFFGLTR